MFATSICIIRKKDKFLPSVWRLIYFPQTMAKSSFAAANLDENENDNDSCDVGMELIYNYYFRKFVERNGLVADNKIKTNYKNEYKK